ncbi:MAG TPA: YjbQ family protein [Candidatus Desulfofervidus auxilii]|uniref:YjbQ family protein n=1 Tax=Desulfofervidus auxilii TaxID=1621989 RepID=A0A7C0U1K0_DESA2|nr:YjbQ family protein [Candidatus Desulfofervidus auxilii]
MEIISLNTTKRTQFIDITNKIAEVIRRIGIKNGLCIVYVPHTTAGVTINENADPSVAEDILNILNQIVPWQANYKHLEGNSPAHIKASIIGSSVLVIIENGHLVLGTWQGIFFAEFDGPRSRKVFIKCIEG